MEGRFHRAVAMPAELAASAPDLLRERDELRAALRSILSDAEYAHVRYDEGDDIITYIWDISFKASAALGAGKGGA